MPRPWNKKWGFLTILSRPAPSRGRVAVAACLAVSFAAGRVCPSRAAGADVVPHCPACRGRVRHSARPPDTAAAGHMPAVEHNTEPAGEQHTGN